MPGYYLSGLRAGNGDTIDAPATVGTNGQVLSSDGGGGTSWETVSVSTAPLVLATNTVEQRNGINPQSFAIYGTRTDADNYERLRLYADGTAYQLASEAAGTGTKRTLKIGQALDGELIRRPLILFADDDTDLVAGNGCGLQLNIPHDNGNAVGAAIDAIRIASSDSTRGAGLSLKVTAAGTATLVEAMRISHDRRVGIGTSTPQYLLDIHDSATHVTGFRVQNSTGSSGSSASLGFTLSSSNIDMGRIRFTRSSTSGTELSIWTYASSTLTQQVTVKEDGSVHLTKGVGHFSVTPPSSQPATPTDLAETIAILQSYGMCA